MPRMPLTIAAEIRCSRASRDTRIKAQIIPSKVESTSEPAVTTIVSQTPCNRIGRNSRASARNFSIVARMLRGALVQTPFLQNLLQAAIARDLVERGVDLGEQVGIALAHADPDRAGDGRSVAVHQPHLREQPLLDVVGEDRLVRETRP